MHITPWEVKGIVDYDKIVKKFGVDYLDEKLIERLEVLINEKAYYMIRRKHFFTHRDFDKVIKSIEEGKNFFVYTGRGPSGDMHIGHLIPFLIVKWFQENLK